MHVSSPHPQKMPKSRRSETLFSAFSMKFFLRKYLVQAYRIYSIKRRIRGEKVNKRRVSDAVLIQ